MVSFNVDGLIGKKCQVFASDITPLVNSTYKNLMESDIIDHDSPLDATIVGCLASKKGEGDDVDYFGYLVRISNENLSGDIVGTVDYQVTGFGYGDSED